jgi:hypothetical protein
VSSLIVTQEHDQKSLTTRVGTQVQVKLSKNLQWSDVRVSDQDEASPVLRRLDVGTASTPETNAVFVATHAGTVSLSAHGRAKGLPGQAGPQFVIAWHTSIEVR